MEYKNYEMEQEVVRHASVERSAGTFLTHCNIQYHNKKTAYRHLDIQYYKHSKPIHVFVFKKGEKVKTEKF